MEHLARAREKGDNKHLKTAAIVFKETWALLLQWPQGVQGGQVGKGGGPRAGFLTIIIRMGLLPEPFLVSFKINKPFHSTALLAFPHNFPLFQWGKTKKSTKHKPGVFLSPSFDLCPRHTWVLEDRHSFNASPFPTTFPTMWCTFGTTHHCWGAPRPDFRERDPIPD